MTVLDVLRSARSSIATPERWCQCYNARNMAVCASYALLASGLRFYSEACDALRAAGRFKEGIPHWNDAPERTHAEVLATFDAAIAAEQAKESLAP